MSFSGVERGRGRLWARHVASFIVHTTCGKVAIMAGWALGQQEVILSHLFGWEASLEEVGRCRHRAPFERSFNASPSETVSRGGR